VPLDALDDACHPRVPPSPAFDSTRTIRRAGAVLRAALETLPPRDRDLLTAYFKEGLTVAEIARRQCLEQKALYRRVAAILARLRRQITPQLPWPEALATIGMGLWEDTTLLA
jgi:DNA-directed RNA polymerase specialized sigma24 family protein